MNTLFPVTNTFIVLDVRPSYIVISGPTSVDIGSTTQYTATVRDRYNREMPNEPVRWSVSGVIGVSVSQDGKVTVAPTSPGGDFRLTATCANESTVQDHMYVQTGTGNFQYVIRVGSGYEDQHGDWHDAPETLTYRLYQHYDSDGLTADVDTIVDWGDGQAEEVLDPTLHQWDHTYPADGEYIITFREWKAGSIDIRGYNGIDPDPPTWNYGYYLLEILTPLPKMNRKEFGTQENWDGLCAECYELLNIPENIFINNPQAIRFDTVFNNCTKLRTIPGPLWAPNSAVQTTSYMFSYCYELADIPVGLFSGLSQLVDTQAMFESCGSYLPEDIYIHTAVNLLSGAGLTSLANSSSMFAECKLNTAISLANLPALTDGQWMFSGHWIDVLPADQLLQCPSLQLARQMYASYNKQSTTANPPTLSGHPNLVDISDIFQGWYTWPTIASLYCTNMPNLQKASGLFSYGQYTVVPTDIFFNCPKLENIASLCAYTTSLEEVAGPLVSGTTTLSNVSYAFQRCTNLRTLPDNLFGLTSHITSYWNTFQMCRALEVLGANLINTDAPAVDLQSMFVDCSGLVGLPAGLVNAPGVTTVAGMFQRCTSLASVPANLITSPAAVSASAMFDGCTSLTTFEGPIFSGPTALTNISNIFRNCPISGTIPGYLLGTASKIASYASLFENNIRITSVGGPIICSSAAAVSAASMFRGCTQLSNIANGIVQGTPGLTTASRMFQQSAVVDIPALLFDGCTALTDISYLFHTTGQFVNSIAGPLISGNSAITTITSMFYPYSVNASTLPSVVVTIPDYFFGETSKITSFSYLFSRWRIAAVPRGLLASTATSVDASRVFWATRIESGTIPEGLLPAGATTIQEMFYNVLGPDSDPSHLSFPAAFFEPLQKCTNLARFYYYPGTRGSAVAGEVGDAIITETWTLSDAQKSIPANYLEMFASLLQVTVAPTPTPYGAIPDWWNQVTLSSPTTQQHTFKNCFASSNYDSVPADWK